MPALKTAVITPEEAEALGGALLAAEHTLIDPILIGDAALIREAADEIGKDVSCYPIIDIPGHRAATAHGVVMISSGEAAALMKGHLQSSTLLSEMVKRDGGLRVRRLIGHVFVIDVPRLEHLLLVMDTAFHYGHSFVNDTFAIPRRFYDEGVRRYGFHGLSYDYPTGRLREDWPHLAAGRVVISHLGNGASMCAVRNGRSVASTMGFTALDGLPMGTRSGSLDPGVLLHLLDKGMSPSELTGMLYRDSGLLGLSGISHDMRTLLNSDADTAQQTIDYYVFRIRRELGGLAAVLGGLDGLVFAGGIGENSAEIRVRVLDEMEFLGLGVNEAANAANETRIGAGRTPVLVIQTDEERMIARAVVQRLGAGGATT